MQASRFGVSFFNCRAVPERKTHHKGIAFDDPSGERLRDGVGMTAIFL